jgi:hypothetical protein
MIHHISIAALKPLRVAQVLAELLQGQAAPFPSHEGSFIVITFDAHGTLIEILPQGSELIPGTDNEAVQHRQNALVSGYTAVHAAISVPVSELEIFEIGLREGWRVARCNRGGVFDVIEFWIENQMMLELLPPADTEKYLAFTRPKSLNQVLAALNQEN